MNAWIPKPECNIPFDLPIDDPKKRSTFDSNMDRAVNVSALKINSIYNAVPNIVAGPMAYEILGSVQELDLLDV